MFLVKVSNKGEDWTSWGLWALSRPIRERHDHKQPRRSCGVLCSIGSENASTFDGQIAALTWGRLRRAAKRNRSSWNVWWFDL